MLEFLDFGITDIDVSQLAFPMSVYEHPMSITVQRQSTEDKNNTGPHQSRINYLFKKHVKCSEIITKLTKKLVKREMK
jgi:hypothetical protein